MSITPQCQFVNFCFLVMFRLTNPFSNYMIFIDFILERELNYFPERRAKVNVHVRCIVLTFVG